MCDFFDLFDRLLGHVYTEGKWQVPKPLTLEARAGTDRDIRRQLSIVFGARRDLRASWNLRGDGADHGRLDVRLTTGQSGGSTFYGLRLTGPSARAGAVLTVSGKWLKAPMKMTLAGSAPATIPNARGQAIVAAFTSNGTRIHEFFDRVSESWHRYLESDKEDSAEKRQKGKRKSRP